MNNLKLTHFYLLNGQIENSCDIQDTHPLPTYHVMTSSFTWQTGVASSADASASCVATLGCQQTVVALTRDTVSEIWMMLAFLRKSNTTQRPA